MVTDVLGTEGAKGLANMMLCGTGIIWFPHAKSYQNVANAERERD